MNDPVVLVLVAIGGFVFGALFGMDAARDICASGAPMVIDGTVYRCEAQP